MFVCFECCVLSGRGLCDELITPPEESCRLWCVIVIYKPRELGGPGPLRAVRQETNDGGTEIKLLNPSAGPRHDQHTKRSVLECCISVRYG